MALFTEVLDQRCQVLGPSHPDTLVSRLGLGLATAESGDLAGAIRTLDAALHACAEPPGQETGIGRALRAGLAELRAAAPEPESEPGRAGEGAEPVPAGPVLPAPRRPRGARFPRELPEPDPSAAAEPVQGTPELPAPRRPRGARFPRELPEPDPAPAGAEPVPQRRGPAGHRRSRGARFRRGS